ncbi:bifunctional histidinol-phosphatase/imidazoleglycerol-phosphate dehydratase HisB [Halosquirtibacter laminarini]|uniref:Bifunctional histidinol-phosphatase/imidazoleglycerol-phosphate dehydratase HisB n=1 Tax=Halosquirtibacter laminarini TaxID=3374600 RepID=A0AC61NM97_9BACT|nr:bifunctional histidinol-phosphatase/imidazoleglycerol-phosphate dehydratase HisB [Prolixibacteraceae bacterium]
MYKTKILFIDRDGTLIDEPTIDQQIDSFEKLQFEPEVFGALKKIVDTQEYQLVMVTNQDGLGTTSFPEETFWGPHNRMMETFQNEGITFEAVHIDRTFASDNAPTRKPRTGLLEGYFEEKYDLENSLVIGDRETDVILAKNLGCKAVFYNDDLLAPNLQDTCLIQSTSWNEIVDQILFTARVGEVKRTTAETDIQISINLDSNEKGEINTGLKFFDHMLEQIDRHGGIKLDIQVKGDLEVDEHHTIEDVGLALGEAMVKALGNKKGIARYGFLLPMDDCLAQVAIDFGGRPWIIWDATFKREYVGDMPTEMFFHFFKSFSDKALCNINIKAEGENEHHKIEGIFKAFAKSIKMACKQDKENFTIPSTKETL